MKINIYDLLKVTMAILVILGMVTILALYGGKPASEVPFWVWWLMTD